MATFRSLACFVALTLVTTEVRANPAEDLLQEAMVRYSLARFKQSLRLLQRARRRAKEPKLLGRIHLYLGLNYSILGQVDNAKKAFRTALSHDPALSVDPKQFKVPMVELFRRVRSTMRGELMVTADRDAEVLVDGKRIGKVPFREHLVIGPHRVEVRTPNGRFGYTEQVALALDQQTRVTAQLKKRWAKLTVRSTPSGAQLLLDGHLIGRTPIDRTDVGAGTCAMTVRLEGYREHTAKLVLAEDQEQKVEVKLEEETVEAEPVHSAADDADEAPRWRPITGWGAVGTGGALLITGVVLGVLSKGKADDYNQAIAEGKTFEELDAIDQEHKSLEAGAIATLVIGGVIAAAGGGLLIWDMFDRKSRRRAVSFAPTIHSTGTGLSLIGRF